MGTRTRIILLRTALLAGACWSAAHGLFAGEPTAALTPDESRTVAVLIGKLDADSFDVRQEAALKLAALGARIRPALEARLHARPASGESPELRQGLKRVLTFIQRAEDARAFEEATRDFDKAIGDAPLYYLAPDPSVDARLQAPITFEFVDMPLLDVADYFRQQSSALIFIDPFLLAQAPANINLRVTDMKTSLALAWIVRLMDCEYIVRGRVVVITTKDRALRLRLRGKTLQLPVPPGGTPWTREETTAFVESLKRWTLHDVNVPDPPRATVTEAGKFDLIADREVFEQIEPLLAMLGEPNAAPVRFQPLVQEFVTKMNEPLRFSLDKKETIKQAADDLASLTGFEIGAEDVGTTALDESFASKDATGFDYLAKLCEIGKISASHSIYIDKNHIQLMPADVGASELIPCVVDLRAALKAGASQDDLDARIGAIFDEARQLAGEDNNIPQTSFVRGFRLTMLDVWNARRVAAVIASAAKTGKVPNELPPLPEFLKKRMPVPEPAPAANAAEQK